MSFFKKIFSIFKKKEEQFIPEIEEQDNSINIQQEENATIPETYVETPQQENKTELPTEENTLPWIEASDNQWGIKLLDLRPISQTVISTSQDQKMAENAISYGGSNGTEFWGIKPKNDKTIIANLILPIEGTLEPGVLFAPQTMAQKWAIFFDGMYLIFVRSWLREVFVIAKTTQNNNQLIIENIIGEFSENESEEFTKSTLVFLLASYGLNEILPAPLPKFLENNSEKTGYWAFSLYGNKADFATFDESYFPKLRAPLRTHSLLHIAVAQSDIKEIENQIRKGVDINSLAGDGLASLHWSMANETTDSIKKLLELGADVNIRSKQGATPLMNAVQANKLQHLNLLIKEGAYVNAKDDRGYSALHRAAEMGHIEAVKILLQNKGDKNIETEGNTPLSLAISQNHKEIIDLLDV